MIAKHVNGTTKTTTARTAEDAPVTPITGNRPTARIRISLDRLPEAPEPTLPCRDQEEKISSFAMSWSEEQHRKRVDASERQKKWRRKHDGA